MFLNLQKYITPNETIVFRFGIGLQYVIVSISLWTIFLGGLSYYFRYVGGGDFLVKILLTLLILISFYYLLKYLTTAYFVTDIKIYKRVGVGFVKVTSAKHKEVDDMIVVQGFAEWLLFRTGTLKFNTPGSAGFEIVMPRVESPNTIKKQIYEAWK